MQMTNIDINLMQKYVDINLTKKYEKIVNRMGVEKVKIVNTGMVSSGKSSLFNSLIDSVEQEYFPTGAAHTTKIADAYDYKNIEFIDTPGIDVRSEADALAFETIMEADIILMVHNIKTGPLNRTEAEWLENIAAKMADEEMRKSRIVFVCTWKDTREKESDYAEIIQNIQEMVFESVGTQIPFFEVSVKKYLDGNAKKKDVLMQNSGILELKNYIENYATEYLGRKQQMDEAELETVLSEIRQQLCRVKQDKTTKQYKAERKVADKYRAQKNAWKNVFDYFSSKRDKLSVAETELRSI